MASKKNDRLGQGRKAMFLNMAEDGIKIRSTRIESKTRYNRKDKAWKKDAGL